MRRWLHPPWSWQGVTAMIMALTIVVGVGILVVGVAIHVQYGPLPDNLGGLLTAVLSALIGSVATFLGRASGSRSTGGGSNDGH